MNKLILICLLFVIPAAIAQDCNNPLLTQFGITKLSAPTVQTGLQLCKAYEGTSMCCSTATINALQTTIDTWVADLIEKAAARDMWLLSIREDTTKGLPSFKAALATVQTNAAAANTLMTAVLATPPGGLAADSARRDPIGILQTAVAPFVAISSNVNDNVDTKWESYEKTRATCMDALLKAQASLYCASCAANYNSQGINNAAPTAANGGTPAVPAVALTTEFKAAISGSCQPFLVQAQIQNQLVRAYAYRASLATLATRLGAITDTTLRSATGDTQATVFAGITPESLTEDEQEPLAVLTNCVDATDCAFVHQSLLKDGGVLNRDYAANGGAITVSSSSSRRVLPEAESRTLAIGGGTLNPNAITSGVTVDFPEDAIAAAMASGFRQGGLMTCFVALIAALLF